MKLLPQNDKRLAEGGIRLKGNKLQKDTAQPLISIVMVVYNGATYIEDALKSVFEQPYQNIEFVIIDGGSNDGTVEIIKKYNHLIDYWVSEPDKGQSDAFNKGFSVCSGVLATWLNSDELLVPNCIEKVANEIKKNQNIKWLAGNVIMTDKDKRIIRCRLGERGNELLTFFGILNVYGPSSFFSLEIFNAVGCMNINSHYTMDTDLWWRFHRYGISLHRMKEYVYIFRMHENSKTAKYIVKKEEMNKDQIREKQELCDKYLKCSHTKTKFIGRMLNNLFRMFSLNYMKSLMHSWLYQGKNVDVLLKHMQKR